MSPVEMKKIFEDLREEVAFLAGGAGPEKTMVNEVWVELKYNPVIRQLGLYLDCNTGTFPSISVPRHASEQVGASEISEGQYIPRLRSGQAPRPAPEQNPIPSTLLGTSTGELGLAPRFVSGALMLKKLNSVLALIDERVPLDTLRGKPQPEQKPVLQRAN